MRNFEKDKESFYFGVNLDYPLELRKKELRSELEYDSDVFSEKTALKNIKKISQSFNGGIYLLTASQTVEKSNKLRTKKGVLWQEKELRKLENRSWEVNISESRTRLVSLVDLGEFDYKTSESIVLNWVYSLIILSTLDIDTLSRNIHEWPSLEEEAILAYDYGAIAKSLESLPTTLVLRYFPAENGRNEMLVVAGNKDFIDENVASHIS